VKRVLVSIHRSLVSIPHTVTVIVSRFRLPFSFHPHIPRWNKSAIGQNNSISKMPLAYSPRTSITMVYHIYTFTKAHYSTRHLIRTVITVLTMHRTSLCPPVANLASIYLSNLYPIPAFPRHPLRVARYTSTRRLIDHMQRKRAMARVTPPVAYRWMQETNNLLHPQCHQPRGLAAALVLIRALRKNHGKRVQGL
jgi:hypothetical protein